MQRLTLGLLLLTVAGGAASAETDSPRSTKREVSPREEAAFARWQAIREADPAFAGQPLSRVEIKQLRRIAAMEQTNVKLPSDDLSKMPATTGARIVGWNENGTKRELELGQMLFAATPIATTTTVQGETNRVTRRYLMPERNGRRFVAVNDSYVAGARPQRRMIEAGVFPGAHVELRQVHEREAGKTRIRTSAATNLGKPRGWMPLHSFKGVAPKTAANSMRARWRARIRPVTPADRRGVPLPKVGRRPRAVVSGR